MSPKHGKQQIILMVATTGIASVTSQLVMIREFLSLFSGNEFLISAVLFIWLFLGGIGTLVDRFCQWISPGIWAISCACFLLCVLGPIQVVAAREFSHVLFLTGSARGFYPILGFVLAVSAPYCLLVGWLLPFCLRGAKQMDPQFSTTRIYMADNIGDALGGALFSFFLVWLLSPVQAAAAASVPLLVASLPNLVTPKSKIPLFLLLGGLALVAAALALETSSLFPGKGTLEFYRETPYGRVAVIERDTRHLFFQNGVPLFDSQDRAQAEQCIHLPLVQVDTGNRGMGPILLVSASPGRIAQAEKHHPARMDYLEIDAQVSRAMFEYKFLISPPDLRIIHGDAATFLDQAREKYDAVILSLPEPLSLQANRFYTREFFTRVKSRLTEQGVASFSIQGYDNYPSPAMMKKLSALYATISGAFDHVLILPGPRTHFIMGQKKLDPHIPRLLQKKQIPTLYLEHHFHGDFPDMKTRALMARLDDRAVPNTDFHPILVTAAFENWFEELEFSPRLFFMAALLFFFIYLAMISGLETLLFTTGCCAMGTQMMIIFSFQILFGSVYLKTGIIITLFLAGLLPGALAGQRLSRRFSHRRIWLADILILMWIAGFTAIVYHGHGAGRLLGPVFFYGASLATALLTGLEFALCIPQTGDTPSRAAGFFAADLMGGAAGIVLFSLVLLPVYGMFKAGLFLALIKGLGLARSLIWTR